MSSGTAAEATTQLCALCNKTAPYQCSSCHNIRYCSAECQKSDWRTHKLACKSFKNLPEAPGPDYIRMIYLHEKGSRPVFVWLRIAGVSPTGSGEPLIDIKNLNVDEMHRKIFRKWRAYSSSGILNRPIPYLTLYMSSLPDGEYMQFLGQPNESAAAVALELKSFYTGPILFFGQARSLDTIDFCNAMDILRWEHYQEIHVRGSQESDAVTSVMMNCAGDVDFCRQEDWEPFQMPPFLLEPGQHDGVIELPVINFPIGDLIGIPLVLIPALPSLPWRGRTSYDTDGKKQTNEMNTSLAIMQPWVMDPLVAGSVVVARKNRKPLYPWHIEALFRYSVGVTAEKADPKGEVKAELCPAGFKKFWEELKAHGNAEGVQSPYEV